MISEKVKNTVVLVVSYLYVLLFVYAAMSKLLDFEHFRYQLGQSPLLSVYASWIAPGVLILEFLFAFLLLFPVSRYFGLVGSFFLMVYFTVYIYLILNFSSFVPCSCGGVLEAMTWNQHLLFNLFFAFLAVLALFFIRATRFTVITVVVGGFVNGLLVYGLFLLSENTLKYDNPFIRRFSDYVVKDRTIDLGFNSYYFAGGTASTLYLGNYTTPLVLTAVDTALQRTTPIRFTLEPADLSFRSVQVQADSTYFYLYDGTVPCLFRGKISDRKATMIGMGTTFFSTGVLFDPTSLLVRTHNSEGANSIGVTRYQQPYSSFQHPTMLEKQIDGNFDTDGLLMYDPHLKRGVYLYRYRNQYLVFDPSLSEVVKGRTIDTISQAQLNVVYSSDGREKKLAGSPLVVNHNSAVSQGLLFVQSGLIGRFEDPKIWQQAAVIDVYNLRNQSYVASFYVYHENGKKLRRFFVEKGHFYGFIGSKMVRYGLRGMILG